MRVRCWVGIALVTISVIVTTESESSAFVRRLLGRSTCCSPDCGSSVSPAKDAGSPRNTPVPVPVADIPLPPLEDRGEPIDLKKLFPPLP